MERIILQASMVISGVFISSLTQIILKTSAKKKYTNILYTIVNYKVILSYIIFAGVLAVNIYTVRNGFQVKDIALLESLGYVFVPLLSMIILKEKISKRQILSMLLILSGVIISQL